MAGVNHPFPALQQYATSGLLFPWAFTGNSNAHLGEDGVGWTEEMYVEWKDFRQAVQALLGYSYRRVISGVPTLRRVLPWQHPYFNQLFVKNIQSVVPMRMEGTSQTNPITRDGIPVVGVGDPFASNRGPWTEYNIVKMVVQFWRPPYYIRSDTDILDADGVPQEWLRFTDREWTITNQVLSREGQQFLWATPPPAGSAIPGAVGATIPHIKLKRTWYQIPEAALFTRVADGTPGGIPFTQTYTQTGVINPVTFYYYLPGTPANPNSPIINTVNVPIGESWIFDKTCDTTLNSATITMADTSDLGVGDAATGLGISPGSVIVSITNGTTVVISRVATRTDVGTLVVFHSDRNESLRFWGFPMGTLRFEGAVIKSRPLQLPPSLMQIPFFRESEPISQQQYDVEMHFDYFDPPRPYTYQLRGHNLMPWTGNGMWYPVNSQQGVDGAQTAPFLTPFHYAQFTDLFKIL